MTYQKEIHRLHLAKRHVTRSIHGIFVQLFHKVTATLWLFMLVHDTVIQPSLVIVFIVVVKMITAVV